MQSALNGASLLVDPVENTRRPRRPALRRGTRIAGLTVSDSDMAFTQREALSRLGLEGNAFAEGIFERCGVKRRHLNLDEDFQGRTLQGRTEQVEHDLLHHAVRAVDALDVDPSTIGTVLSSSLYSLGCPSLAHRLVEHYEMDPTTDKYHLSSVGCASGVPLMRLGRQALTEHPGRHVLVVAAESMSGILMPSTPEDSKAKIVGSAIFGDGCAAALLTDEPRDQGPMILASQVHQVAGSLGAVSLHTTATDSHLHLERELPDIAGAELGPIVDGFLARNRLERSEIDHWIVHPGGRRIIENIQTALDLSDADVEESWDALAEHGNVGTPSIFYVLKDTVERRSPEPGERALLVTIGPGVTIGLMLLGW